MLDGTPLQTVTAPEPLHDDAPEPVVARIVPVPEPASAMAPPPRHVPSAAAFLGLSIASGVCAAILSSLRVPWSALFGYGSLLLFGVAFVVALARVLGAFVTLARRATGHSDAEWLPTLGSLAGNLLMVLLGAGVAFMSTLTFSRGRQLRRAGRVLLPSLGPRSKWAGGVQLGELGEVPQGLADQWRENGRTEHASVAAFARLTLDLMALGAPPTLIADANRDALDEIHHAELCFGLARALDGRDVGPAPFPEAQRARTLPRARTLALSTLAVDSLIDGALHEGVSARVIARLARRAEIPEIRAVLKMIAADEGRHAAHGWAVVKWCLEEGGRPVASALLGALETLPETMSTERPKAAVDGSWERWGIHGHEMETSVYEEAIVNLRERVTALVARPSIAA